MPIIKIEKPNWRDMIFELNRRGLSNDEIAQIVGVAPSTVLSWKNQNRSEPHLAVGDRLIALYKTPTPQQIVIALCDSGMSSFQIARAIGVSSDAVRSWKRTPIRQPRWEAGERLRALFKSHLINPVTR